MIKTQTSLAPSPFAAYNPPPFSLSLYLCLFLPLSPLLVDPCPFFTVSFRLTDRLLYPLLSTDTLYRQQY